MKDKNNENLPAVFLSTGEVYISEKPTVVTTVLGSCITVTMFNRRLKIGGMCHGLLPTCEDEENCNKNPLECFKFVDCSIWKMTEKFEKAGIKRRDIEVKMFGGAKMFKSDGYSGDYKSVGERNIEAAEQVITDAGLNLIAFNVGGMSGRKVIFYTHTGDVLLKITKI